MNLDGANPESGATDLNGAAARLARIVKVKGEPTEPTSETGAKPEAVPPKPAQQQAETKVETPPQQVSDTPPATRRVKAKLGDRDIEFDVLTDGVDLDLIPKGLMMVHDYRQKTMDIGNQRKELEGKQQLFDRRLSEAEQILDFEVTQLESDEMQQLKATDPKAYWAKVDTVRTRADQIEKWKAERQQELNEKQKGVIDAELQKVTQLIPEWLDSEVKTKEVNDMYQHLQSVGFTSDELNNLYDSRLLAIARKAMLYDQIKSTDLRSKQVLNPPPNVSPGAGKDPMERPGDRQKQSARARLKQTGNLKDAQKAISGLLKFKEV